MRSCQTILLLASTALLPLPASAQGPGEASPWDAGVSALVDVVQDVGGGVRSGTAALVLVHGHLGLDLEALWGVPGVGAGFTVLGVAGRNPSELVGDRQGVDNIAAPDRVWPYEAWIQALTARDRLSILAGLYDVNAEFDVLDAAGLFLNASFGIGAAVGLSGPTGPSIYPSTALGVRVAAAPHPAVRARAAFLDGTPGRPGDPGAFDIAIHRGDGALALGELVLLAGEPGGGDRPARSRPSRGRPRPDRDGPAPAPTRLGIGVWHYSGLAHGAAGPRPWGAYVLAGTRVSLHGDDDPGLNVFLRGGVARAGARTIRRFAGAGVTSTGELVPGRPADQAGIGVVVAWFDGRYLARSGDPWAGDTIEPVLEATYLARVADGVSVQPDLQLVAPPGGAPGAATAVVLSVRVSVTP